MYYLRNLLRRNLVYSFVENVAIRFCCSCYGCKTLQAPNALDLCPVCWWEDDGQEDGDASEIRLTVNGQLSLSEARDYCAKIGGAHPPVRAPRPQAAGH